MEKFIYYANQKNEYGILLENRGANALFAFISLEDNAIQKYVLYHGDRNHSIVTPSAETRKALDEIFSAYLTIAEKEKQLKKTIVSFNTKES